MCDSDPKLKQVVEGYQNYDSALDSDVAQSGGGTGYILDLEQPRIGGQPKVTGYVSQPEYLNGSLVQKTTPDGLLMGDAEMCGGGEKKKKLNSNKKNNNYARLEEEEEAEVLEQEAEVLEGEGEGEEDVNNKKVNNVNVNDVKPQRKKSKRKKSKRKGKGKGKKRRHTMKKRRRFNRHKGSKKKSKRGKGRYDRKNRSKNRRKYKKKRQTKMTGGDAHANANNSGCQYEVQGEGQQSVYTDDMMKRTFDGKQPNWNPETL